MYAVWGAGKANGELVADIGRKKVRSLDVFIASTSDTGDCATGGPQNM